MLGVLIDNVFVALCNLVYQRTVRISIGINFVYSYHQEFVPILQHEKNKRFIVAFNSTFRYIDDNLSIKKE
jgi:hypothetical protein